MANNVAGDIFRARLIEVPEGIEISKREILQLQHVIITEHDRVETESPPDTNHREKEQYLIGFSRGVWAGCNPNAWFRKVNQNLYVNRGEFRDVGSSSYTEGLKSVTFGVSWTMLEGSKATDLDVGCMMLNSEIAMVDSIDYQNMRSSDGGSVRHGGDAQEDRGGDIDDEQIHIIPADIPESVMYLAFYLSSYSGRTLHDLGACSVHIFDTATQKDFALIDVNESQVTDKTSVLLAILIRSNSRWYFGNLSSVSDGISLHDNIEHAHRHILECTAIQRILYTDLISQNQFRTDISYISTAKFLVRTNSDRAQESDSFGASVVMFDRQGRFIDGVDSRRVRSRRGPLVTHRFDSNGEEFILDLKDPQQDNVFVYFVVLNGRNESSDLRKLGSISVDMINADSEVKYFNYSISVNDSCGASILMKFQKDIENPNV